MGGKAGEGDLEAACGVFNPKANQGQAGESRDRAGQAKAGEQREQQALDDVYINQKWAFKGWSSNSCIQSVYRERVFCHTARARMELPHPIKTW